MLSHDLATIQGTSGSSVRRQTNRSPTDRSDVVTLRRRRSWNIQGGRFAPGGEGANDRSPLSSSSSFSPSGPQAAPLERSDPPQRSAPPPFVLDLVAALVEQGLLRDEEQPDGTLRYRMLTTVRLFGLEQLAASGDEDAARDAHAGYFRTLPKRATPGRETAGMNRPGSIAWRSSAATCV